METNNEQIKEQVKEQVSLDVLDIDKIIANIIKNNVSDSEVIMVDDIIECKNPENATTSVVISPQNLTTDIPKNIINIDKITKYMNLYPINPTKYGFVIAGLPLNMIYVANFPDKKVDTDTDIEYPTTEILDTYSNELECYIVGKTTDEVRKMFQTMFIDIQSLGLKGTFTRTKTMIEFTIIIENKHLDGQVIVFNGCEFLEV